MTEPRYILMQDIRKDFPIVYDTTIEVELTQEEVVKLLNNFDRSFDFPGRYTGIERVVLNELN